MRSMIGNSGGQLAKIRHQQDKYVLANETLVRQPVAPVGKPVGAGRRLVKFRLAYEQREVFGAHLPARKRFAQSKIGSELVGRQTNDDDTRTRTLFEKTAYAEVPVQVLGLFNSESADRALCGQMVLQLVHLNAFNQQGVSQEEHGRTRVWGQGTERPCCLALALLSPFDAAETGQYKRGCQFQGQQDHGQSG